MGNRITIEVGDLRLSGITAGSPARPAMVLLHGWPLCSAIWNAVLQPLSRDHFAIAFDLPGTGRSTGAPVPILKTEIAATIIDGAEAIGAKNIIMADVDVGGMVAFAAARDHSERIAGAVIMNTALPGIDPWDEVLANPRIWHFALHQIPCLPESLVAGRERIYFDFFLDTLANDKRKIEEPLRQACAKQYASADALRTGFDWYRAMPQDAEHNSPAKPIDIPILYMRGGTDHRLLDRYLIGLHKAGANRLQGKIIAGGGELMAIEAPDLFVAAMLEFTDGLVRHGT